MTHCSGKFGVRVNGQLQWFTDQQEALKTERAQLAKVYATQPKLPYVVMLKASKKGVRT